MNACLKEKIKSLGKLAIGYSGGADSTYLAQQALEVLRAENVLLLTGVTDLQISRELDYARSWAASKGIRLEEIRFDIWEHSDIVRNDTMRCYHCKKAIFQKLLFRANALGFQHLADGFNADDRHDYRPGKQAADELGVLHLLEECDIGKKEILAGLGGAFPHAGSACLASRIPTGTELDPESLRMVNRAEDFLQRLHFSRVRVRKLGGLACIELHASEIAKAQKDFPQIELALREIGFAAIEIDPAGYRQGRMNAL